MNTFKQENWFWCLQKIIVLGHFFFFFSTNIRLLKDKLVIKIFTTAFQKVKLYFFSKDTQPFYFIKHSIIQKTAYKFNYIIQINGGLIMFFFGN